MDHLNNYRRIKAQLGTFLSAMENQCPTAFVVLGQLLEQMLVHERNACAELVAKGQQPSLQMPQPPIEFAPEAPISEEQPSGDCQPCCQNTQETGV